MENEILFHCIIFGRCKVKKNTQKVVRNRYTGQKMKINSPQYNQWEQAAIPIIYKSKEKNFKTLNFPLTISFKFYFKNHQGEADLSNLIEGPQDVLKSCGIISDDKLVYSLDGSRKYFGDNNERVEIQITRFKD